MTVKTVDQLPVKSDTLPDSGQVYYTWYDEDAQEWKDYRTDFGTVVAKAVEAAAGGASPTDPAALAAAVAASQTAQTGSETAKTGAEAAATTAAGQATLASGFASTAAAQAGAAASSATAAAGSVTAAAGSATAAANSALDAAAAAQAAIAARDSAISVTAVSLGLPSLAFTNADFSSNIHTLDAGELQRTIYLTGVTGTPIIKLPPGLFSDATGLKSSWVEIVNRSAVACSIQAVVSALPDPVVRYSTHLGICRDTTAGSQTTYDVTIPVPALNKGCVVMQGAGIWNGSATHGLAPTWQSGLVGSFVNRYSSSLNNNYFVVDHYAYTFQVGSFAGGDCVVRVTAESALNGASIFFRVVDETDGYSTNSSFDVAGLAGTEELTQPRPISSTTTANNKIALFASWKRAINTPSTFSPATPGAVSFTGTTQTPTQTGNAFVLSYVGGYQSRSAMGTVTYQATFGSQGGSKRWGNSVVILDKNSTGGGASSTVEGATSVAPGKSVLVRALPDALTYFVSASA